MRMKQIMVISMALTGAMFLSSEAFAESVPDEEIRRRLVLSCSFEDDPDLADGTFKLAFKVAESNRVRFARIICDLATTNDAWIAESMIDELGFYGSSEQLPFLYSQISNATYGASAVRSILRIEGLTSNSVAMVDSYLSMTNIDFEYRAEACEVFLRATTLPSIPNKICQDARLVALNYATHANRYVKKTDQAFMSVDSTYQYSKRRLSVLRSVNALGVSSYQIGYVTNAINELVAYPEADLPE